MSTEEPKNLFEHYGMKIEEGVPNVGDTLPIYGIITDVQQDRIIISNSIIAHLVGMTEEKRKILLERSLEDSGIFVLNFLNFDDTTNMWETNCQTIIFGRKEERNEV